MFTLSRIQFFLLLFIVQTGTVFITFQSRFIVETGPNSWVVFIFAGILHYVQLLLFEKFHERFNPGPIVSYLFIGYWFFVNVTFLAYINYTLAVWIFPKTPTVVIMSIIVGVSLYANTRRPETVINLPVFVVTLIPLLFSFLFLAFPQLVWTWLFPLNFTEYKSIIQGLFVSQATFFGIEIFLFLRKYVKADEPIKGKPLFIYQSIWFLFFFTTIIFVMLFFPVPILKTMTEPLIQLLKSQKVTFIERLDLFLLFIWVIWSTITSTIYTFMCIHVRKLHNNNVSNRFIIIFHILLVIAAVYLTTKERIEFIRKLIVYAHIMFSIFIPTFVILMNRGEKK